MPMNLWPRYPEWLLLTAGIQGRRADTPMKYLDSLIQHLERHPVAYNYYLNICDVFFTADYWLKANPCYTPAHAAVENLYQLAVKRLCDIFKCTVNVLPRELELMFGRGMTYDGYKTDLLQGRARTADRDELGKYRVVFKQGKAYQFPHWEAHPAEVLKPVESSVMYEKKVGLKKRDDDMYCVGYAFFVMTMGRDLYLRKHSLGGERKLDGVYHSNYTGGAAVLCAGSMLVEGGVIKVVRSDSGHYKPEERNMVSLLLALQMHGVNISKIKIVDFSGRWVELAPAFIETNGDWTKFVTDRDSAATTNGYAYANFQSDLQRAPAHVAPGTPRVQGVPAFDGKYIGKNPNLPPNFAKPPQAPPRPPRPGQAPLTMQNGQVRSGRALPPLPRQVRTGRPLPPLPGQGRNTPGYSVRVPGPRQMGEQDLYQT